MEERISSAEAAKLIGIKTQTLAKWRWQGRGPRGWVQVSTTHVTYQLTDETVYVFVDASRKRYPTARVRADVRTREGVSVDYAAPPTSRPPAHVRMPTGEQVRESADHREGSRAHDYANGGAIRTAVAGGDVCRGERAGR
jgi:hypothetical protein